MKTIFLLFVTFFGLSYGIVSQNENRLMPKSIYTASNLLSNNDSYLINKKLKLTGYEFVYVNQLDLDVNQLTVDFRNFSRKPTKWINDDYLKYRDENLLKGFRLKYDPTCWNLQCPNPLSVPYVR